MSAVVSIEGAAEIFRIPATQEHVLCHDRAGEIALDGGGITLADGRIVSLEADLAADLRIDATGCAALPGLVDCHTHLPFCGWRADEYALKARGASYEEIARAGGGIRSSARAFDEASDDAVIAQARGVAAEMLQHGTTTLECKSGYGLSVGAELRALALAERLAHEVPQSVLSTALLAHAVPDGFSADSWMDAVAGMMGAVAGLNAIALDIYVESVAFGLEHLERMGALAAEHGLAIRAHVEQFSTMRSVPVALRVGARSVDHLACLPDDDIEPLARADCAAVLLPGAELLGDERVAPGRALADAGATCVLATDCNPGTSPVVSLPLIVGLAVRRYGWTVREALLACTQSAAWVLSRSRELGALDPGKRADVVLIDCPVAHVPYRFGRNPVALVVIGGEVAWVRPDQAWRLSSP
jgi:imidazolonepropionase